MPKNIYIAFYCSGEDTKTRPFSLTQLTADTFTYPFTHVVLVLTDPNSKGNVQCFNLSESLKVATLGEFSFDRDGYCFFKIQLDPLKHQRLLEFCKELSDSQKLHFSRMEFYGLNRCWREPCSKSKTSWFCSELISWILQEFNILKPLCYPPEDTSVTDLFLLVRKIPGCIQLNTHISHPKTRIVLTPDTVYQNHMGVSSSLLIPAIGD